MSESRTSTPLRSVRRDSSILSPIGHMSPQVPSPARSQSTSSLPRLGSVLASKSKLFTNVSPYTTATAVPPSPPLPPPPSASYAGNKKRREHVRPLNKV